MKGSSIPDTCHLYRVNMRNLTMFKDLVTIQLETEIND